MGFRYEFPRQQQLQEFLIDDEVTEFVFPADYDAWSIPVKGVRFYEALFEKKTLSKMGWVSTPVTIETTDSLYLAIHEANLTDYAAMNLKPVEQLEDNKTVTLRAALTPWSTGEKVRVTDTRVSPWRTMIVAESAGDLLLSRLMLNLNEPCRITDTSWIQPMRYIGIWWTYHMKHNTWHAGPHHGATTENTMRHIDFAAANNLGGVLVEGWNEDWATWKFSFTKPYTDFDIQRITDYGRSKGVALIGHHETGGNVSNYENQMEDGFKFYEKYGVHQVKTGYVGDLLDGKEYHSSQFGVLHYRKVIEAAARHRICIDNHEPVIPTGLQRTFPNLMTQEGVRGQEWDAWDVDGGNPPSHTVILPFTRGLAGPMDFTPVTFRFVNDVMPQTRVHTTLAKQLALFVVLYSPLQMASDEIENYEANPEPFNFIVSCPTDWSRTVVPEACIGSYVTIARCDKEKLYCDRTFSFCGRDDFQRFRNRSSTKQAFRLSDSCMDSISMSSCFKSGSRMGVTASIRRYKLRRIQSGEPRKSLGAPPLPKYHTRACSRKVSTMRVTRMLWLYSCPGMRQQMPRTMRSISTPACEAS